MLIEQYELDVFTPPCEPGAERFAAKALLTVDISAVLSQGMPGSWRRTSAAAGRADYGLNQGGTCHLPIRFLKQHFGRMRAPARRSGFVGTACGPVYTVLTGTRSADDDPTN